MPLPRPASPRALWADLRAFTSERRPHQWVAAALAVAMPVAKFPDPGPLVLPPREPAITQSPPAKKVEPARAKANLASYVSDEDYPSNAARNEEQGTTRFRLVVGPDGKVKECTVTSSSGSSALDSTTCKLMRQRAKFTPAMDSNGKPTGDTVASAIRWVLPSD